MLGINKEDIGFFAGLCMFGVGMAIDGVTLQSVLLCFLGGILIQAFRGDAT